jgi:tRNA(Ile)-lysidine synthase TilS/MesJ
MDGLAGTDEPPIQSIHKWNDKIEIIRPLLFVYEHEIINECFAYNLKVEPSNCGHGDTKDTETPREMVHNRILKNLHLNMNGMTVLKWLHAIAFSGILPNGRNKVTVRNCRAKILGMQYRSGWSNDNKL